MRSTRTTPRHALLAIAMLALASPAAAHHDPTVDLDAFEAEGAAPAQSGAVLILAHAGGLAKDGCHKDRAAGERHWHLDGSAERGGACVKEDGRTVKVGTATANPHELDNLRLLVEAQKAQLADAIRDQGALEVTIGNLRAELEETRVGSRAWRNRATRAEDAIEVAQLERSRALAEARGANADAAAALAEAQEARRIAADAELRAQGVGPRVDRRCRAAVEVIVHGDTGWLSDDVDVDADGRAALSRACLAP